jgi:cytochrome c oxidase cbb3-type subunit 3
MCRWVLVIALVAVLGGCAGSEEYLLGGDLYERSCAACHGEQGEGGIGGPEIGRGSNTDLGLEDEQIAGVIEVGPGNMPGFSRFTREQIDSLVGYVRSLGE